jgi:hypothetical protein
MFNISMENEHPTLVGTCMLSKYRVALFAILSRGNGLSVKIMCTQGTLSIHYYTIYNVNIITSYDVEYTILCGKLGA